MKKCLFISRNYKHMGCAAGKARADMERIMESLGYENIGLRRTSYRNGVMHGILNTWGVLRAISRLGRGDVVVLQYQMRQFERVCRAARRRGVKVICLIHDLDSFRDKSKTPGQEIPLLSLADVLIVHNAKMRSWLAGHGCEVPMVTLDIFDYLDGETGSPRADARPEDYSLFFVGNPSRKLNDFLYQLAAIMPHRDIYIYGGVPGRDDDASVPNLHNMGFMADTEIMSRHKGDFGISWYGESLDSGVGKVGEYMGYNNPHKVGLYLRAGAPVVVWSRAGMADFLVSEGVAVAVDSLRDLDAALSSIDSGRYAAMREAVGRVSRRLSEGYYLRQALGEALVELEKNQ